MRTLVHSTISPLPSCSILLLTSNTYLDFTVLLVSLFTFIFWISYFGPSDVCLVFDVPFHYKDSCISSWNVFLLFFLSTLSFCCWNTLIYILCLNFSFILSIFLSFYVKFYKNSWDFSRGPVAKTPCSQCRSPRFDS